MTYLCHKLASATERENLSDQVYTLLSLIKHDVSHEDVLKCLGEATAKAENEGETAHDENCGRCHSLQKELSIMVLKKYIFTMSSLDINWCIFLAFTKILV